MTPLGTPKIVTISGVSLYPDIFTYRSDPFGGDKTVTLTGLSFKPVSLQADRPVKGKSGKRYSVFHPVSRKVSQIEFWEFPPAGWLIL